MGDSVVIQDWIEKAHKDLKAAQVLFENDCGNEIVAFHCQQAVEKALKALILYYFSSLESGHSLIYLCKKVSEKEPKFADLIKDCALLNGYYTETRYPNENQIIVTNEEANTCIDIASNILSSVNKILREE